MAGQLRGRWVRSLVSEDPITLRPAKLREVRWPDLAVRFAFGAAVSLVAGLVAVLFGGKAGVAEGLWREGFERLRQALEQAEGDDPLGRLAALGRAYRANALANRPYYAVMFQRPIPGFQPSVQAYADSLRPLKILVDAVAECIDAGVFRDADPTHVAGVLWAAAHGAVSLELAGYEGAVDAESRFQDLLSAAAAWFFARRP